MRSVSSLSCLKKEEKIGLRSGIELGPQATGIPVKGSHIPSDVGRVIISMFWGVA